MFRRVVSRLAPPAILAGNQSLQEHDPEMHELLQKELKRQVGGIELIASENFTSRAVLECLGSVATNKYAEGYPGARYYGGNQIVDQIENLCKKRALEAYRLDPAVWGVNVQPYSGSPANFAVYTGLLAPHDRFMGLDLPCGGHLTHGFYTPKKKISATSIFFESLPYHTTKEGVVDLAELRTIATTYRPKLIIAGGSAYPREWDYEGYRAICDAVGCNFMVDMAHFSGLVAAGELRDPFEFAEIVTTTTHKTLRGPRSGMIFYRKVDREGKPNGFEEKINAAVFPGLQGGPHEHQIAAVCTQLKEVMSPEFKVYAKQVKANSAAMADELVKLGYKLASGGTDNHLVLWDLNPQKITGSKMEKLFDCVDITTNKNTVAGDKSAMTPGGLRLGAPAMTTRGLNEEDFREVARYLDRGLQIGLSLNGPGMKLTEFQQKCKGSSDLKQLEEDVVNFATKFPFPGSAEPFPLKK